jgi:hypothetical protein
MVQRRRRQFDETLSALRTEWQLFRVGEKMRLFLKRQRIRQAQNVNLRTAAEAPPTSQTISGGPFARVPERRKP